MAARAEQNWRAFVNERYRIVKKQKSTIFFIGREIEKQNLQLGFNFSILQNSYLGLDETVSFVLVNLDDYSWICFALLGRGVCRKMNHIAWNKKL